MRQAVDGPALFAILAAPHAECVRDPGITCDARYDVQQGGFEIPGRAAPHERHRAGHDGRQSRAGCRARRCEAKSHSRAVCRFAGASSAAGPRHGGVPRESDGRLQPPVRSRQGRAAAPGASAPSATFHRAPSHDRGPHLADRVWRSRRVTDRARRGARSAAGWRREPGRRLARERGGKRRRARSAWQPVNTARSFLLRKLRGTLGADEGAPMPSGGAPLTATEIALVAAWIAGGAPGRARSRCPRAPTPASYTEPPPLPTAPAATSRARGALLQPGRSRRDASGTGATAVDVPIRKIEGRPQPPATHHFACLVPERCHATATGRGSRIDNLRA